jgi:hypothetical protein
MEEISAKIFTTYTMGLMKDFGVPVSSFDFSA